MSPEQHRLPGAPAERARILMLTYISPLQKWGSAKRSRFLIDALERHGRVEVLVFDFVDGPVKGEAVQVEHWRDTPVTTLRISQRGLRGRPRFDLTSEHVSREVARHFDLGRYDLLVSRYVKAALKLKLPDGVPVLVDFDDALYEPPWRTLRGPKQWVGVFLRLLNDRLIVRSRLRHPRWRDARFLFCREAERQTFGWLQGAVLPNLPPLPDREGPPDFTPPARPALMFIGLLDYMPNHDAVDWFIAAIWPRVRREVPQARFLIVGDGTQSRLDAWREAPGVETLGFVDSLEEAYAQATACVVPMRSGAGTNIKALEPYLYGRMVIATPLVVEGHDPLFTPGDDVLVAPDAEGLARHCIEMLREPLRASAIARKGHGRITEMLTVDRFRGIVDTAVAALLHTPRPSPRTGTHETAKDELAHETR